METGFGKNQRHPLFGVMDYFHQRIGIGGDDGKCVGQLAGLPVYPRIVYAAEEVNRIIF